MHNSQTKAQNRRKIWKYHVRITKWTFKYAFGVPLFRPKKTPKTFAFRCFITYIRLYKCSFNQKKNFQGPYYMSLLNPPEDGWFNPYLLPLPKLCHMARYEYCNLWNIMYKLFTLKQHSFAETFTIKLKL